MHLRESVPAEIGRAVKKMKKGQVTAIDEMRVEVVAKYLNQLYKKIVEYLYGGRKNPEFMCMTGNTEASCWREYWMEGWRQE